MAWRANSLGPEPSFFCLFFLCFFLLWFVLWYLFLFLLRRETTVFPPKKCIFTYCSVSSFSFSLVIFPTPSHTHTHSLSLSLSLSLSSLFFYYLFLLSLFLFFLWLSFFGFCLCSCLASLLFLLKRTSANYYIWKVLSSILSVLGVSCLDLPFKSLFNILVFLILSCGFLQQTKLLSSRHQNFKNTNLLVNLGVAT